MSPVLTRVPLVPQNHYISLLLLVVSVMLQFNFLNALKLPVCCFGRRFMIVIV